MNMEELSVLKSLLNITDNSQDEILKFYLESAKNVICEIRNSDYVEDAYVTTKIKKICQISSISIKGVL